MIGETTGHYRILEKLGSGGMGVVYRAEDLKLGRNVALKFLGDALTDDPAVHDRFVREARAAAALNHPNICTVYEINDAGPRPFIAMELLEGRTLQDQLASSGPLPLTTLLDLAVQVADALDAAHAKGLIHRDIKPTNVFVTADGRAKVVDFGLAKATVQSIAGGPRQTLVETAAEDDHGVTRPGTTIGTIAYMSPEQARGETVDARSDLFSFGLVLYEMATGRRAFDGATSAVVFDGILNRMPLPPSFVNPEVPRELEQIIGCAIEKDPAARYQKASDIASDLRRLRRASDPEIPAVMPEFVPSGARAPSPAWGVTPARGIETVVDRRPPSGAGTAPKWRRWPILFACLGALAAVAAGLTWWFMHAHSMPAGAPVLVTDFVNRTGDPDFDGTLKQALTIKLEESPYVRVLPQQKVREILSLMARRPDDAVTPAVARDMCERIGGGAALMTGEIVRLGSAYVLTLGAESCNGEEIGREQAQAARKEDVLNALGGALSAMRGRLGESLASIRSHDMPLMQATTSSLPALKSLSVGDQRRAAGADLESIPFYQRAVKEDPEFALAWARLGTVYGNTGEDELSRQCYQKAYDLRDRASEHERFYITSHYYRTNGELAKAREVYETWRQQYPHDFVPAHNLGIVLEEMGEPEQALQAFQQASAMEKGNRLARESVAGALFALGRLDEARAVAEREVAELGDSPQPHLMLYGFAYIKGDAAAMAEHARKLAGTPFDLDRRALDFKIALFEGRFNDAGSLLDQLVATARSQGRGQFAVSVRTADVLARAVAGLTRTTRTDVARVLADKPGESGSLDLAFALVLAGDRAKARTLASSLWPDLTRAPSVAHVVKPAFDAMVVLREGKPTEAIDVLKSAEPWEERFKTGAVSAYVRGLAYLALGDGRSADQQFQKVLRDRWSDYLNLLNVVTYTNLGRAKAMAGDTAGARVAYDEFFRIWKNADPDVPLLQEAKAEYAKLK